jgi:hypothetical protein
MVYGVLFHLGCLWTLTYGGVCGGFIFRFAVICSNFVLGRLCLFQYFGGVYIIF